MSKAAVSDLANSLVELDFNVSDEDIERAKEIWLSSATLASTYLQTNTVQHPV